MPEANVEGEGCWFEGIKSDLRLRLPLYISDWTIDSWEEARKILAATLFAYFTSVLPAVIFGDQLRIATDGTYGLMEVLVATGGLGVLYSIFAGQGLVIVGVTGPVVFFEITVFTLSRQMDAPFLQFNAWVNIWCGFMHVIVAAGGYTKLVQRVTAFSGEIFGFFISVAYVFLGAKNLVDLFPSNFRNESSGTSVSVHLASAFASLILAALMYLVSMKMHHAKQFRVFNDQARWFLQSYGVVVTLIVVTALSFAPIFENPHMNLERLPVPFSTWDESSEGPSPSDSTGRSGWVVDLLSEDADGQKMKWWMIIAAIGPALMLLILFFFDHNVSSILAQDPKFNLKKPPAFNWDFTVLGVLVALCGIFGVPPGNGLIPQAPLHVRALAVVDYEEAAPGMRRREVYTGVVEKRWSNLLQSLLCLLTVLLFPIIKLIPQAVLAGTFLYMGASGFFGNGLFERLECMMMQASRRPDFDFIRHVPWGQIVRYTALQAFAVILIFFVSFNLFLPPGSPSIAVVFPLLIAILIPLRDYWIPTKFTPNELDHLDPPPEMAEDLAQKEADFDRTKPPIDPDDLFGTWERFSSHVNSPSEILRRSRSMRDPPRSEDFEEGAPRIASPQTVRW